MERNSRLSMEGPPAHFSALAEKEFDLRTIEGAGPSSASRQSIGVDRQQTAGLPKGSPSVHLDALRGFAAFSVLLAHWRDAFFVDYPGVPHHNPLMKVLYFATGLGHQWVIVFFVMSGYLVGGSVMRSVASGRWSWRGYLLARLTRLYVVLLPALLLGGAIDWAGVHVKGTDQIYAGQSGMHLLPMDAHATLNFPTFIENSLFLQTIALPGSGGRPVPLFGSNGPLWSLANEFWYYIAFPVLVLLFAKGRSPLQRALCAIGLVVWVWFVGSSIALLAIPWLLGVLITFLPPLPAVTPRMRHLAIAAALVLVVGGMALGKAMNFSLSSNVVLGLAVTLLIWVTLHYATAPLPALYVKVAHRSAHSSYTLYLVHLPMLIFLKASLHMPRAVPNWPLAITSTGLLLGIIAYGQIVYELFERNTDHVRDWIKPYVLGRRAT
jgi:peptidoglycan/LPS O-acetylase OafA/YrhL